MTIELRFQSVIIEPVDFQEKYPIIFSALQPYLPAHKPQKRRRPRKKKKTVSSLIDAVIDSINVDEYH